ncbi:MAG TPA: hypothetical protein VE404_05670, partial [Verrucomicrobiae bacterium]|nr:hypothetical protein [Verrucomicrobiae bacterium]
GDAWRVARGVVVQVSLRADSSRLKSEGFTPVAPRRERRRSIALVETLCDEGFRIEASGGASNASFVCGTRLNSNFEPSANLIFTFDANTPARLGKYDLDHDGTFNEGRDGSPWRKELSTVIGRRPESFSIRNVDLSPRFAVGWDPWSGAPSQAGKTRVFATWGRYYDRLPLLPIAAETTPYVNAYTFTSDPQTHRIDPNAVSSSTSTPSIETVARDLETPRTDILTAGFTRELSVTWVAGITWTRKRAARLLQDADRNHLACRQFGRSLGVDPNLLCPLVTDVDGNIVRLNDQFGSPNQFPNGLVDLYVANPSFDRILRVGNFNDASFDATTLAITKRLLAGWQLQASYTFSRSRGEGEDFTSLSRDDPALSGLEHAPLAWDQRHVVVLAATGALARDVDAGMSLRWESGTPYSVEAFAPDLDNLGNPSARAFFPTGARNDQRNGGAWSLDGRLAKRFRIGRIQVGAEIAVRNLMNQEATAIAAYVPSNVGGAQLVGTGASPRRPGRSWQLGAGVYF